MEAVTAELTSTLAEAQTLVVGAVAALVAIPAIFVGVKIVKRVFSKA